MRILLPVLLCAGLPAPAAFAQDACRILEQETQAFSSAGQRGDGAAMARVLDPDVIFFNETGQRARRSDMASATPPPAGAPIRTIATTDWDCKLHGDTAVTSFIDVLQKGKPDEAQFRSVEAWKKESSGWKMIGSETLTVQGGEADPEAVTLDARVLDDYAGSYEAPGGIRISFSHRGADLVASLNGGAESIQKAQARDIFFTPGRSTTPKVFQRDAAGKVTGFLYLRGKNSLTFKRIADHSA